MYLRIKVSCDCGCSYSIDNSMNAPCDFKCPNCQNRAVPNTYECLNSILNYARSISLENGHIKKLSFKACSNS